MISSFEIKIQIAELDLLMKTYKNQQVVGKVAIWIPIGQIDDWRERDTANYTVVSLCRCCLSSLLAVLWDHLVLLQDSFFSNRPVFYLVILSSFEKNVWFCVIVISCYLSIYYISSSFQVLHLIFNLDNLKRTCCVWTKFHNEGKIVKIEDYAATAPLLYTAVLSWCGLRIPKLP